MDEEYVQEHILTGGIVRPAGGASPTHSWPLTAISLGVVAPYPTHLRRAPRSAHAWSALRMVACVAAGEALGQRARLLVGGLNQTVADTAMLGAFTDCENIGCAGDEMIVDDDAAIDRDTGVSGDFGVRLDADRNNDRVGRKHAAVLELYTLDVTIADESRRR
jgi:hypothetical protein